MIKPCRQSSIYGITLLQVYSYCNSHCSRDRWPLKSLVRPRVLCYLLSAQDLKRTLAGRSFVVCIFESFAIQSMTVTSFWLGSLTLSAWFSLIIRLIISPSQILGIIQPSRLCHGMSLLLYVLEVLMAFLGLFQYACVVAHNYPDTHKRKHFLNLKAIALSGSELVCYDQLLPYLFILNKVFSKLLYSSTFDLS